MCFFRNLKSFKFSLSQQRANMYVSMSRCTYRRITVVESTNSSPCMRGIETDSMREYIIMLLADYVPVI